MTKQALHFKPEEVCLVPESREEITTEGGLDVAIDVKRLKSVIRKLHSAKIEVSAFIDAELKQVEAAHHVGAQTVELHTGAYANATTRSARRKELARHGRAAAFAHEAGLRVNAGHGLHYNNVREYIEDVPHLHTLNIGHAIISRALFVGLEQAIREMLELLGSRKFAPHAD
jgi:pyridoxine 5-phosphate synthase